MEKSNLVLSVLKIVFWIVLVGLIFTTVVFFAIFMMSVFKVHIEALSQVKITLPNFNGRLSDLKSYGTPAFSIVMFLITLFCAVEAYLISLVIKILHKVNLRHPFSEEIARLINKISKLALVLALASFIISGFTGFLTGEISMNLDPGSGDLNFLLFAGIVYIIGTIYKSGVDLQSENDLTI